MSSIKQYQVLQSDGTRSDRIKYILSLVDKNEIEQYLKQSSRSSYVDLQMLIFLSISTKNQTNLLQIVHTDSFPIEQRTMAAKNWLKLQKDEKQIENFIVQTINDKTIPRYLKTHLLSEVHQLDGIKKSPSFFYELICRLIESNSHSQYNLDAHLLPFCTKEQILDLLSRWSLKRIEQFDYSSPLYLKLVRYHPLVIIQLIQNDLNDKRTNREVFASYFRVNDKFFKAIAKKEPNVLIRLSIDYLKQLEKHQRALPPFIQLNSTYYFHKTPNEMIELITLVGANKPGSLNCLVVWSTEAQELDTFSLPHSFSSEHYVRLFFTLYETCQWSLNHTIRILPLMLPSSNSLGQMKKQRTWLYDTVINKRIGKEIFLKKLLKEGDKDTLRLLNEYPELTTPLSLHLISQAEQKGIVTAPVRLELLRYQLMTQQVFDQFLLLFKETGSDVNQRQVNYPLFFQCALSTNDQFVSIVLQWIAKRFANEQLIVIEHFLGELQLCKDRFHLEMLPKNFQSIQGIIDIAMNHLQQSNNTLKLVLEYGIVLLKHAEYYSNKEQKTNILTFATNIIKQSYSKSDGTTIYITPISEFYPQTRHIIADILVSDVLPKLVAKSMMEEISVTLDSILEKAWLLPQIDLFVTKFFAESFSSSTKLQSQVKGSNQSSFITFLLQNRSTRLERVHHLINQIDKLFFIDEKVQRIVLRSQQYRSLIDEIIADDRCVTTDKLANGQNAISNMKFPGLYIDLLLSSSQLLTGKQQEHITKIILNDYLQDKEVRNLDKLKSLRVLRRLPHTYHETLQWLERKQESSLVVADSNENNTGRYTRGALDDIIICLPSTMGLTPERLCQHLEFLKTKLNASNAKYISDAMLNISRRLSDEVFLKSYLEFIHNEQFRTLGITANKEILRLLIEYVSDRSLVELVIQPLWNSHPHQDIRACLILILLHFIGQSNEDENIIYDILEEAANDDYLPVVKSLFSGDRGSSRWPLTQIKAASEKMFEIFVNRIQMKVLDHSTSLEARAWAWSNIDDQYCDRTIIVAKAQQLVLQFDKNGNSLYQNAFKKMISSHKQQNISASKVMMDIIQQVMSRREEIDSKENAIDNQHDLPVYHRVQNLFDNLLSYLNDLNDEIKSTIRSAAPIFLRFDQTLATSVGIMLIKIAQSKEELEDVFKLLEENLPGNYFERVLTQLSSAKNWEDASPLIQSLNVDEKLQLIRWFIEEKQRGLFFFDLLINSVFNQPGVDREQCQRLLRQLRECNNLFLRQQAMEYTVAWKEDGMNDVDSCSSDGEMSQ